MFHKKKLAELQEALEKEKEKYLMRLRVENSYIQENCFLREENTKLKEEITVYKEKYLNALEKNIELAEKMVGDTNDNGAED